MSNLKVKLSKDISLEMDIDERITFIGGDSAIGKTFLIDVLEDAYNNSEEVEVEGIDDLSKIIICKGETEAEKIDNIDCEKRLILLDRYDKYSKKTKKKIWNQMSKLNSTWILMTRYPDIPYNYGYSDKSFKTIKQIKRDNKISLLVVPAK